MDPFVVPLTQLAAAFLAAAVIATVAWRRDLLDPGGTLAAALLGPALVATGGWWLGVILIAFFVTAALLPQPAGEKPSRTWHQVLANGGPAVLFATIGVATDSDAFPIAAAATIAATTADTWATEIGRAWGGTPISVRTGRRVPPGTSGAVSAAGTLASVFGAAVIAGVALLLESIAPTGMDVDRTDAIAVAIAGALGSTVDTVLGATLQARFACATCGARSESPRPHLPGHPMHPASGVPWLTNSVVNLLAALAAGIVALLLGST